MTDPLESHAPGDDASMVVTSAVPLGSRRAAWARLSAFCLLAAIAAALIALANARLEDRFTEDLSIRAQNTLRLTVAALRGELGRFERLPQVLADREVVRAAMLDPGDPLRISMANDYLRQVNTLLGSTDVYLILPDGLTVAASNQGDPVTFVGQNFRFRPYFIDALAGREGRYYALGTTSLKRGYYFAAPIRDGDRTLGVLAIKIDVDSLETAWRDADYEVIVTDPQGIVFMSSRPDWRFASLGSLTGDELHQVHRAQRYAGAYLHGLGAERRRTSVGTEVLTLGRGGDLRDYVAVSTWMEDAGWTVEVLVDIAPARLQAQAATLAVLLGLGLMILLGALWRQRQRRLRDRETLQEEARQQLEVKVIERTSELAVVNRRLEGEVAERRSAEAKLRLAQSRLVQSGKLAALGQMSAALSHEFNQPLGAVRNFADNALAFIERGRVEDARENLGRIVGLTDRMSEISRALRNFARQPGERLVDTDVAEVVRDSLSVIGWRLKRDGIALRTDLGEQPVLVRAGPGRFQQVIVNLVSNAADSLDGHEAPWIAITLRRADGMVTLSVADNGPGVPPALSERIFDPFFSTKGVGKGLGLGLSISYNIVRDFGGELRLGPTPGGGATFSIDLNGASQGG